MSTENASDVTRGNKRTRFTNQPGAEPATEPSTPTSNSPLAAAKRAVTTYAATLQPNLATIVVDAAENFLSHRAKLFYKENKLNKMKRDIDSIPQAAKVGLKLEASAELQKGDEYLALAATAADTIANCQKELKSLIVQCTELNVKELKTTVQKSFSEFIPKLAEGFLTHDNVRDYNTHQVVVDLLDSSYDDVTCNLVLPKEVFVVQYCEVNEVESLPAPSNRGRPNAAVAPAQPIVEETRAFVLAARQRIAARTQQNADEMELGEGGNAVAGIPALPLPTANAAIVTQLKTAAVLIYVTAWAEFNAQNERNEQAARLKRLAKEQRLGKKADDVSELLNSEGNVDPKCLRALIQKEVEDARKADTKRIQSLETKLRNTNIGNNNTTKNRTRGQGGAAKSKKNANRSPSPSNRSKSNSQRSGAAQPRGILKRSGRGGRGADDRNRDSPGESNGRGRNHSTNKSDGKRPVSRTRRGKSSDRSKKR